MEQPVSSSHQFSCETETQAAFRSHRTEVLHVGEVAQVRADLGEQGHHCAHAQTVDARQINACPVRQALAYVEFEPLLERSVRVRLAKTGPLSSQPAT